MPEVDTNRFSFTSYWLMMCEGGEGGKGGGGGEGEEDQDHVSRKINLSFPSPRKIKSAFHISRKRNRHFFDTNVFYDI